MRISKSLGISLAVATLVASAYAVEPVARANDGLDGALIVIADVQHGTALVPEGTVLPRGISFSVQIAGHPAQAGEINPLAGDDGKLPPNGAKRLVLAYAPDADFEAARAAIAANEERRAHEAMTAPPHLFRLAAPSAAPVPHSSAPHRQIVSNDTDQWTYLYFEEGSYAAARRVIITYGGGYTGYAVQTAADSADTGVYASANVWAAQSSNLSYGGFDPYAVSVGCSFGWMGGYCNTPTYGVDTNTSFSATVTSTGTVSQRDAPPCGRFGEPPCTTLYSGTITNVFP